jgi:glycosyltransferase involved in cell wall biosynthesis
MIARNENAVPNENEQKRIIGSDVTLIRGARFATGIHKVMVETHRNLSEILDSEKFVLGGFTSQKSHQTQYQESNYLSSDPLLSKGLLRLADLDIALLLDLNLAFSFRDIIILKRHKKLPLISLIHDLFPILHPEWFDGDPVQIRKIFRDFLQKNIAIADHLVVTSSKVKRDIESLGWKIKGSIHQFNLGASVIMENTRERVDNIPTLLYLSSLEPRKGHMDLLAAFEILRKQGVKVRLVLVGRPGLLFQDIAERIRNNPDYGSYLFWHSNLMDADLMNLYNSTTLSVIPSLDEGFGLALEESLARQVPVLARRLPIFEERPNPNLYFFNDDSSDLVLAILERMNQEWIPIEEQSIRTMKDFAKDMRDLIESL